MAEALETGSKTALAMAAGDARAMGQSIKHLLTKESVEAFAGMTKQEARYLTRAVESLAKETGDYVSDHLFATLRSQFEKGTSRAKAVKFAKDLFHKREAVDRIYDYLDDAARAALYELAEAEDVLQEEIEQLGKIAQTYQAEAGKALTKTQLDDLIGDSTLGEKSVEEVVAGLVKRLGETISPNEIRFSQSSVNGSTKIIQSMKEKGWIGDPIDIVKMPDGIYTTIDNTRVVAAREVGIDVQASIHTYNDPLPSEYIERFTTKKGIPKTWGEAIELRVAKQKASFREGNPYGNFQNIKIQ